MMELIEGSVPKTLRAIAELQFPSAMRDALNELASTLEERPQKSSQTTWYLDRQGRLCYFLLDDCPNPPKHVRGLDGIAQTLYQLESVVKGSDFLWREYKRLTDILIDGDYFGPLRGETNCALNVAHFLICFVDIAEKELPRETANRLRQMAYALRKERWPEELGW